MGRGVRLVRDLVDVEEARARNVRREVFVAAAAAAGGHVPAGVYDDEVGLAQMFGQPFRRNERFHSAKIGYKVAPWRPRRSSCIRVGSSRCAASSRSRTDRKTNRFT